MLPGEDEARLTFLAVRRWFGWSAGRLAVFDIGGGSLEIAGGDRRGARRRVVAAARRGPAGPRAPRAATAARRRSERCASTIRAEIARDAGNLLRHGHPDHAVATSKTFRSLARICGAAPSGDGPLVPRVLAAEELAELDPEAGRDAPTDELADLPGVSPSRAHQILPGALVAGAVMDIFDLAELEICPWALREGVILERIDQIGVPVGHDPGTR